jgi:hypothetical protein
MIPRAKDGKSFKIGEMSMSNKIVRKFMEHIESLIDFIIKDLEKSFKWKKCLKVYKELIYLARQKEDFSDDDIRNFQDLADTFFLSWIDLHDKAGVTNYIHMLGAGNFTYFLKSWESLNSLIKQYYFRKTQQGGFGGIRDVENSKIIPIAKWFQRKLWWQHEKVLERYSSTIIHK